MACTTYPNHRWLYYICIVNSEVFLIEDISAAVRSVTSRLKSLLNEVKSDVLVSVDNRVLLHTRYQFIFNLKFDTPLEKRLFELILNHAMEAEKLGPGAFDKTLETFLGGSSFSRDQKQIVSRQATVPDVENIVIKQVSKIDESLSSMLREALGLAGFGGRIIVEKTHSHVPSVELSRGYNFEISPAWSLSVKLESPRAFVIDGYIEQVSEIHHLLEATAEAKEPAVLFVRGLSEEVLQTLRVNFDRGTLKMVPIIVKFDLEGINSINDIAVVTGCNLVSCNKGDLISSIKFEEAPILGNVVVYPGKVVVQHDKTCRSVASHITFLRKKRAEDVSVEDVGKLYDKRIRSLSPSHVVIKLPDAKDYVKKSQAIDIALRTLRSMVDHGVIDKNGTVMPASTLFAVDLFSSRCRKTISDLGTIIHIG
jgi:chaperonin GroEL (HSP60 family)